MHQPLRQGLPAGPEHLRTQGIPARPPDLFPSGSNDNRALEVRTCPECGPPVTYASFQAVLCPGSQRTPGQLPAETMYLLIFQALSGACKAELYLLCPKDFLEGSVKINQAGADNSLLKDGEAANEPGLCSPSFWGVFSFRHLRRS